MASIVDNSTALEVMRDANEDFLEFIGNLKALLNGTEDVTFTMGKYTITVESILKLIQDYQNGVFDSIIIGGQSTSGKQIILSVDSSGRLKITDAQGNLAYLDCSSLEGAIIKDSTVNKVTAQSCTVKSIKGTTSVTGGNVALSSFTTDDLTVDTLNASQDITTPLLVVNQSLTCSDIFVYGSRKLIVKSVRNVFYIEDSQAIINNDATTIKAAITNNKWNVSASKGSPTDLGFKDLGDFPKPSVAGMIVIQGINTQDSFVGITTPSNIMVGWYASGFVDAFVACTFGASNYSFSALCLWPIGCIYQGSLVLCVFSDSDIGKDVYYRTGGSAWTIYRTLAVTRGTSSDLTSTCVFGNTYTVPAYSCVRFILNKRTTTLSSGGTQTVYSLEIA